MGDTREQLGLRMLSWRSSESSSESSLGLQLDRVSAAYEDMELPSMPMSRSTEHRRSSWLSVGSSGEEEYLREHLSSTSPFSSSSPAALERPRAPTPSAAVDHHISLCPQIMDSPISDNIADSHSSIPYNSPPFPPSPSQLVRSVSDVEPAFLQEHSPRAFARPPKSPKSPALPDPTQFPDPYPFRPPHHHLTSAMPALSSAGSSSASTRSSAYTSSGSALASGDYGHVHVASVEDDSPVVGAVGISSDAVVQLLENDPIASSSFRGPSSRMHSEQSRWSESYSASSRSRSSSTGNSFENHPPPVPRLREKPSYDMGWHAVEERDETGASEDETDDEPPLADGNDGEGGEGEEERTNAAVIAEEGRGLIVQGDGLSLSDLIIQPGTTHLLLASSTTPNAMPGFLATTIPQICNTLLALDLSANFLGALPPCLSHCYNLEELNIASNPLRVLPVFLSGLTNLRLLIADATGISTLPDSLSELDKLHTISIRRNKLHSLPSWLCLLPALTALYVDGNPFQGPWKALVEPLLAQVPMTPVYPPSTPMYPKVSPDVESTRLSSSLEGTDVDDLSDPSSPGSSCQLYSSPDEEQTITPERAPFLGRTGTALPAFQSGMRPSQPSTQPPPSPPTRTLQRTRTTPNRAFHDSNRGKSVPGTPELPGLVPTTHDNTQFGEIRKMKSAGDLRRGKVTSPSTPDLSATVASKAQIGSSVSASTIGRTSTPSQDRPPLGKRFASLGPSSITTPSRVPAGSRPVLTQSLWDGIAETDDESSGLSHFISSASNTPNAALQKTLVPEMHSVLEESSPIRARQPKEIKEKGGRWGFLKKMSMGKMKPEVQPRPFTGKGGRPALPRPHTSAGSPPGFSPLAGRTSPSPRIDLRLSTTGNLESLVGPSGQFSSLSQPQTPSKQPSPDAAIVSANLLAPPTSPMTRTTKRRSFLPIDTPLQIPIPDASPFVAGLTVASGGDDESRNYTQSPLDIDEMTRREQERARDAYARALRSVMAYLRDMDDLGLSQQSNTVSMYGASVDDTSSSQRSRRPTMSDGSRDVSMALSAAEVSHLRPADVLAGLRSGTASQTISVATTDSTSSNEERTFKDDRGKRSMIIREIVVTERTYVKGLEELMDIYVKPASAAANMLSGVGSNKDTVVPMAERKIVFNGIDSLFSFHKDIFLPALEVAVAPLMRSSAELKQADADGQLSIEVAKTMASMFLKHAAFMRMYSSYINNFDAAVQRIKYWTSERSPTANSSPASATSPSSSAAQLAGIGMAISSISHPNASPDLAALTGVPNLTTGQRKRIRSYLKRCRVHPRHSQLNLEGYLLLPVQRVPRYRLLLEELLRCTPPVFEYIEDPLDKALAEISSLAINMNEGKREAESRRKLVQWQARIRGKFPSPLVQPHRRLIMDGPLLLTRVVRKAMVQFDAINAQGDTSTVQVDCLAPELTPRPLIGILCNDLLVLCRDPSDGHDPNSPVDLWAVLRMQTLPQPASIVHGNALRLVDNKAILYFDAPSPSDALNWYRAINLHIPASKT